jgi:hypothetical protein
MKKELFSELQKSMEQALAHSQGKITLRTKRVGFGPLFSSAKCNGTDPSTSSG